MKKTTKLWFMLAIAGITALSSCKKDEEPEPEPEPDACETAVYPTATGDAAIVLLNFSSSTIEVEAGNTLALAVEVTKGSSRTKKLRLFASDCVNMLGTEEDLSDQTKGGKNGIDLRATDNAQTRNVSYVIPTGMNPIYLTIQIDEGGGNVNYKQLTLNVSGSGIVDEYTGVVLGENGNSNPSRMSSATGQTYFSCDAAENMDFIDITCAVNTTSPYPVYLCSNPARFLAPISLTASNASGCADDDPDTTEDESAPSTAGGNASYFLANTTVDFATATDTEISALTVSSTDAQYAEVMAVGDVFEFMSNDGRKGLIKVTQADLGNTLGTVTVDLKMQR